MADEQIDIKLSLMDQQAGLAFDDFVKAVASIRPAMEAMLATSKQVVEANQATAASMKGGGGGSASTSKTSGAGDKDAPRSGEASPKSSQSSEKGSVEHMLARTHLPKKLQSLMYQWSQGELPYNASTYGAEDASLDPGTRYRDILNAPTSVRSRLEMAAAKQMSQGVVGRGLGWLDKRDPAQVMAATYAWDQFGRPLVNSIGARVNNPQNTGSALGFARDGGDIQLGPLGFQMPGSQFFTEAGREAIGNWAQRRALGFKYAGISHKGVGEIQNALYGLGWTEGDHRWSAAHGDYRDRMLNGLIEVKRKYKDMNTQQAAEIMDQGVRNGTGYVDDMVRILKEVPEVARHAGIGMNEFLDSMNTVANQAQDQGATYQQGAQFAQEITRITGMDPRIAQTLANSNFVQARVMAATGLMPQEQALLDPGTRAALNSRSVQEMVRMYSGFGDRTIHDSYGGTEVIKGSQRAIAMAAQQLGIPPDAVQRMMQDAPRQEALGALDRLSASTKNQVNGLLGNKKDFRTATRLLSDPNYINKNDNFTSWGETRHALNDALKRKAITRDDYQAVLGAGQDKLKEAQKETDPGKRAALLRAAAQERQDAVHKAINNSTTTHRNQTTGKQNVTVDIQYKGPNWFDFNSKQSDAKDEARGGGRPFNRPDVNNAPSLNPASYRARNQLWPGG